MAATAHAPGRARARRWLAAWVLAPLLTSCTLLGGSDADTDGADGAQRWAGHGLVLASCNAATLGSAQIELWEVAPDSGVTTGHRPAVAVPRDANLAYPCSEPAALARRLFNDDFSAVAVQVVDDETGASRVGVLDLANGQVRLHSRPPRSSFVPLPHDGFPVFSDDGSTLWYLSGNDEVLMSYDPEAPSEDAWAEHGDVGDSAEGFVVISDGSDRNRVYLEQDDAGLFSAQTLGLPDPTGRVVAVGDTLYDLDAGERRHMFCTELFSGDVVTDDACMASDSTTDSLPDVRPAAWVDDDTLLAFDERGGTGGNTVVRLEFDDDHTTVTAWPALPASDWEHRSAVVSPDCAQFATLAVRGEQMAIFAQDLTAGAAEPPTPVVSDAATATEVPAAPTARARLIDWVQPADGTPVCAP